MNVNMDYFWYVGTGNSFILLSELGKGVFNCEGKKNMTTQYDGNRLLKTVHERQSTGRNSVILRLAL